MKKSDERLVMDLRELAGREQVLTIVILRHLREVEVRDLYLAYGYPSLFEFFRQELGYSEDAALLRIRAMRLMRDMPEVEQKLEEGGLSISVAAMAQTVFRRENVGADRKAEILREVEGTSVRATEKKLAELFPGADRPERAKPIALDKTRIEFTASDALMSKLTRLKELMAHKNYNGRFDLLFEELADMALAKLEPKPTPGTPPVNHSRYIPVAVRNSKAWKEGCCFVAKGRRCGSRHGLQMDHIQEFADGGKNAAENIQLLYGAHNRLKSRTNRARKNRALPPGRVAPSPAPSRRSLRTSSGVPGHRLPKD